MRIAAKRLFPAFLATVFVITMVLQLRPATTGALGQVTSRSVTMNTSAPTASASYSLTFTPATTSAAASMVIDFCSNDPLVNDTCSFSAATVPTVASGVTSSVGTASVLGSGSPIHTIAVTTIAGGLTSGTPITLNFNAAVTNKLINPTTAGTFYARVITYSTATGATSGGSTGYTPANTTGGTPVLGTLALDSGGIAMSTAANITITSKVYETLAFCVFQTSCGTAPTLTLGDPTTQALSVSSAYVNNNAQYTLATNAGGGVVVSMTGTTLCRSAVPANCDTGTAGQYTITSVGNTPTAKSIGNEQFGMCIDTTGATGGLAALTPYTDPINACHSGLTTGTYTGSSQFGLNDSTSAGGTNNASGDQIMSSTGAVGTYTGSFAFLGDIAATTEAGTYTTSLNLVATSTF